MNKILLSAAALAAILATPAAMADPNDNQPNQHDSARPDRGDNNPGDAAKGSNDNANGPNDMQNNGPRGGNNDNNRMQGNGNDSNDRMRDNNGNRDNDKTINKTVVHKTVDRSTVLKVRANITAPRRFHPVKAYARPAGWYQHRWTYGERLPRAFFAPDYFILDFAGYGLIAPWDGYEWVRYGDDALLIDTDSGEVIRVEYDLFD